MKPFPSTALLTGLLSSVAVPLSSYALDIQFGFSDSSSTKILVNAEVKDPEKYKQAVCGGDLFPVKFEKMQKLNPEKNSGRETSYNFDNLGGAVYSRGGKGKKDLGTCVLYAENISPVKLKGTYSDCSEKTRQKVKPHYGDWIEKKCVAKTSEDAQVEVALVEFNRKKDRGMARVFVLYKNEVHSLEEAGSPCWRVDDEEADCTFIPKDLNGAFEAPFVLPQKSGLQVFTTWPGPEGESSGYYETRSGKLVLLKKYYRYWVPN